MLKLLVIAVLVLLPVSAAPITMVSTCMGDDACSQAADGTIEALGDIAATVTQPLEFRSDSSAQLVLEVSGKVTSLTLAADPTILVQSALSSGVPAGAQVVLSGSGEFLPLAGDIVELLEALQTPKVWSILLTVAILGLIASMRLRRKLMPELTAR